MKNTILLTILTFTLSVQQIQSQQYSLSQLLLQEDYSAIISRLKDKPIMSIDELISLSVSYKQTGHLTEAIELLEKSTTKKNSSTDKLLSSLYFDTGNYDKALPIIKDIYSHNPDYYKNFARYIDILTFKKEYSDAISLLEERLATDSLNFEINKRLGDNYIKIDSLNDAIKHYALLFSIYPENQVVAYKLSILYRNTKKYRESLNVCDTILRYSPENKKFLSLKGNVYYTATQYRNAIIVMKKLESLGDNSFLTQRILGISYYKKDNYIDAASYLKKALEWHPEDPIVNYYIGASLAMLPLPEEGIPYLTDAIDLLKPPPNVMEKIHQNLANIYHNTQNFNLAIDNYKKALKYNPKSVEYYLHIASVYDQELNNSKAALEYYEKFIASLPEKLDTKKGKERYAINLKEYAERRITAIKEEDFFNVSEK